MWRYSQERIRTVKTSVMDDHRDSWRTQVACLNEVNREDCHRNRRCRIASRRIDCLRWWRNTRRSTVHCRNNRSSPATQVVSDSRTNRMNRHGRGRSSTEDPVDGKSAGRRRSDETYRHRHTTNHVVSNCRLEENLRWQFDRRPVGFVNDQLKDRTKQSKHLFPRSLGEWISVLLTLYFENGTSSVKWYWKGLCPLETCSMTNCLFASFITIGSLGVPVAFRSPKTSRPVFGAKCNSTPGSTVNLAPGITIRSPLIR